MGIAFHPSSKSTRERCPSRTVCIHTHAPLRYRSSTSTRFRRVRTAATSAHTRCACKKAHQRQVCTFRLQGSEGLVLTRLRGVFKKHQDLTDAKHQVSVKVRSLPSQPSKVFNAQHLGWQAQHSAQGAQWHAQSHTTSQVSQPCCWLVAPEPTMELPVSATGTWFTFHTPPPPRTAREERRSKSLPGVPRSQGRCPVTAGPQDLRIHKYPFRANIYV